ncbi:MAG: CopD family protein [Ardenticatenaceae bacterium]|nr:CopD family protein [Ardenticatenaceae bacterium]
MFWILVFSYWVHLLATAVWLGGMALMALVAWPALNKGSLASNQWLTLQQKFLPYVNLSLVLLLITGFIQMTNDENYSGFLVMDGVWAWAILIKHIAFGGMVVLTAYVQFSLYPAIERARLLAESRPKTAVSTQNELQQKEVRLLRLNLLCATAVLFCTAVATAV